MSTAHDQIGDSENTFVFVYSDHGEMLDDHDDVAKSKPWQGAISVPLLAQGPTVLANMTIAEPVATLDVGATILDLAGVAELENTTAASLRAVLELGAEPDRRYVHSGLSSAFFNSTEDPVDFNFRLVVARVEGRIYKFVCCIGPCPGQPTTAPPVDTDGRTRLLFDVLDDPFDLADLKTDRPDIANHLQAQLPSENGFSCSSS